MPSKRASPPKSDRLELAARIRELVALIGTQAEAAKVAEVSERQLRMYLAGDSSPPFVAVAKLAQATGADLNWVMSGVGAMLRLGAATEATEPVSHALAAASVVAEAVRQIETDAKLLGRLVDAIGRAYEAEGVTITRHELGEIAAEEYDRIIAATDDEDERLTMVKLVAEKHRHALRTEKPSSRKLGA